MESILHGATPQTGTTETEDTAGNRQQDRRYPMAKYVIKRLLLLIPILLGVSAIIFVLKTLTPGDPARQILGNDATEEQISAKREGTGDSMTRSSSSTSVT
jgi:hypothetical protein